MEKNRLIAILVLVCCVLTGLLYRFAVFQPVETLDMESEMRELVADSHGYLKNLAARDDSLAMKRRILFGCIDLMDKESALDLKDRLFEQASLPFGEFALDLLALKLGLSPSENGGSVFSDIPTAEGFMDELAMYAGMTDLGTRRHSAAGIFSQWFEQDPEAAITAAMQWGIENEAGSMTSRRLVYTNTLFLQWVQEDAAAALDWALAMEDPAAASRLLLLGARQMDVSNYQAYAARMGQFPGELTNRRLRDEVFEWMLAEDVSTALQWLRETAQGSDWDATLSEQVGVLATRDLSKARELLDEYSNTPYMKQAWRNALKNWPEGEFEELVDWAKMQTDEIFLTEISGRWARISPESMEAFVDGLDSGSLKDRMQRELGGRLLRNDYLSGVEYIDRVENPDTRRSLARSAFSSWAREDPARAASYVMGYESDVTGLFPLVIGIWANDDASSAAAFLQTNDVQDIQSYISVSKVWKQTDPEANREWAAGLPEGTKRDFVLADTLNSGALLGVDTVALANTIGNDQQRQKALYSLFTQSAMSKEQAAQWLEDYTLSAADRVALGELLAE